MNTNTGFSLIELMVVIAIVAVLAAVALPSYKTYVKKAGFTKALASVIPIKQNALNYYNRNGVFPDVVQLGFTAGADNNTTAMNTAGILPLVYQISSTNYSSPTSCLIGMQSFHIAPKSGNFFDSSSIGMYTNVIYRYWDIRGTTQELCSVHHYNIDAQGATPVIDGSIINCYNLSDPVQNAAHTALINQYDLCGS